MALTVCIATMKRFAYLEKSLPKYLEMPCVSKVIVCDETGDDVRAIRKQAWSANAKLELHVNLTRLGALGNKAKCMSLAQGWCALIDSDNFAPHETYFKPWIEHMQHTTHNDVEQLVFMPARSTTPPGSAKERAIDFCKYGQLDMTNVGTAVRHFKSAMALLNNGNFIVHADTYNVPCTNAALVRIANEHPMTPWDAALKMLQLLERGSVLVIVPSMSYEHAVHDDSLFAAEGGTRESNVCFNQLFKFCVTNQAGTPASLLPPLPARRDQG